MTVDKFQPSSASDVFSLWWKQFWGLKIPRKILHFAWRGYQEILPTRNGLFRRNIASSTSCQLCGFGGESNAHAIFWCPVAQGIWNLMEFSFLHEVKEEIDFKNVLLYASEVVDREAFAKFIICSWAIWTERNKITHGQQIRQPQFVVEWISSYYESILSMKEGPKKSSQANGRNREASAGSSTSAQEQRLYSKLMVDAAVLSTTSIVGLVPESANFGGIFISSQELITHDTSFTLKTTKFEPESHFEHIIKSKSLQNMFKVENFTRFGKCLQKGNQLGFELESYIVHHEISIRLGIERMVGNLSVDLPDFSVRGKQSSAEEVQEVGVENIPFRVVFKVFLQYVLHTRRVGRHDTLKSSRKAEDNSVGGRA
ncbi:hypothetical protein F8388_025844 [Cannabis sativa]|uniref:Reverse transcriptase zinc-binding domain-containing protein n=1 Tax=Cannabis sativa TaxID=3483 RepID=A0A7J6HP87_CANSA|nr:hypothetical protein F8388_025844 [Cannabis sativa]KAF4397076.1 hypothetical protein G4B88_008922 [Cannabis sativa]